MQFGGLPGLSLKAFYAPLSTTPGLGDIVLLPEQKSYAVSYSLDNSGTKNIGPYKASVGLAGYSLLSLHEIIQASYRRGFPKFSESEEYSGYFKIPVTPDGYSAYAMYSNTNADPSGFLSQLDTISKGETFSFGIEKQFNNEGGSNQTVSFSLTTLDNDVLFFDQSVSRDRLSYVRLSASSTNKVTNELIGRFSISADKGVNVFNPNKNPLNQSRTGADIYPWVFNASAETFYNFNDTIQAIVSVNGIYSPDTLPSSLEMSVGGLDTMPGYKPGYMSGKNGIVATAELPIKPCTIAALSPVCWGQTKDGTEVEIAPFVVTAYLDKEAARIGSISASSAGLKLRVRPTTFLSGELVLAGPLKTHSDRQTDRGIDVLFRIQGGF
jgi:hemolysin activation/secretion protein